MRMRSIVSTLILSCMFTVPASVGADEGMWPLTDLEKLDWKDLERRGLELSTGDIHDPSAPSIDQAVVRLPGATASFVSPEGLIITNHHVAFTAIQRQATIEKNYVEEGFYAPTRSDEIPATGYTALVTLSVEDVTDRILSAVTDDMSPLDRFMAIDMATKEVVKEAEEGRDVKCEVAELYDGMQYMLHTYFEIRDVRIVYAPPEAIGNYGDDIDNWRWPRHGGDFSFLRAYVAPDGSSADYSEDNVPYEPISWLPISAAGVKEGDLTLVIGFPGSTQRYVSSYHIEDLEKFYYPRLIRMLTVYRDIIARHSEQDSAVALRHEDRETMVDNFLLYGSGILEGFEKGRILEKKREQERRLTAFLKENEELFERYGHVLPELEQVYAKKKETMEKDFILGMMTQMSDLMDAAVEIYKWSVERGKPDIEREQGYQDRDTTETIDDLRNLQINLVTETDREIMKYFLKLGLDLPEGREILALERIVEGKKDPQAYLDRYVDEIYESTRIDDEEERLRMFRMSKDDLEALDDPFIELAAELYPELDERRTRTRARIGELNRLRPQLIRAYAAWQGGALYPDATFTMRLNVGEVKSYSPRDAVHYHFITSLCGLMEKETGEYPFIVPEELKEAWKNRDYGPYADEQLGDIPVDFLTTNDGTGGNSGSPILNGSGEIIGLDFDTVYEAVAKDYYYHPDMARSIVCDIRYVLFVIDRVFGCKDLVEELTIVH